MVHSTGASARRAGGGLSVRTAAAVAGLSHVALLHLEAARRRPTLRRLAAAIAPQEFGELRRLAVEDDAVVPDNQWAEKRERGRDAKQAAFVERAAWEKIWRKLGKRVGPTRW